MVEQCPDCGAPVGGREQCRTLFDEVLAREFGNVLYFGAHRTTVDCYALQHPEGYCVSFKSFAAHLTGLCCAIEFAKDPAMLRGIHAGLDGERTDVRPPFIEKRGALTIEYIHRQRDPASHRRAVEAWAKCVWEAWSQYHNFARSLLREMTARTSRRSK